MTNRPRVRFKKTASRAPDELVSYHLYLTWPGQPETCVGRLTRHRGQQHRSGGYWLAYRFGHGYLTWPETPRTPRAFHHRHEAANALILTHQPNQEPHPCS